MKQFKQGKKIELVVSGISIELVERVPVFGLQS